MNRFLVLGALGLLTVAEVAAVLALIEWMGVLTAALVLGADMVAGVMVLRWGARSLPPDRGWRLWAGAFIALPGLVLDLVGLSLFIPAVRRGISGQVTRRTEAALRRHGVSVITVTDATGTPQRTVVPGDVIQGEVVVDEVFVEEVHRADVNQGDVIQGDVIRGEVIRGEVVEYPDLDK